MFCLLLELSLLGVVVYSSAEFNNVSVIEDIDIKEAPYQVAVLLSGYPHCGGAVVGDDIILTSASCFAVSATPSDFSIRVGSSSTLKGGEIYQVKDFVGHPGWSFETEDYDVGIITLSKPLSFSNNVKPIQMADVNDDIPDGEETVVTGWRLVAPDSDELILQRVRIPKVNQLDCKKAYKSVLLITSRMMCAGLLQGERSDCQNSSGGSLVYNNTLSGIVSWNDGCEKSGAPGVFAKVATLRKWIDDNITLLRKKPSLKKG